MSDFRDFFSKNAESFAKSLSHRSGEDLAILIEHIKPAAGETALDLAAGTGFTSLALAKKVSRAVAYDGTPEMLEHAKTLAREEGITWATRFTWNLWSTKHLLERLEHSSSPTRMRLHSSLLPEFQSQST